MDDTRATVKYVPDDSCQIPNLGEILADRFARKIDGVFVEVGAFDGAAFSNTSFLADLGWRGVYIEPVPEYAAACRARHQGNRNISVVQCAIGDAERTITLSVGNVLTTADPHMMDAYREIDWARSLLSGQTMEVPQFRLETILKRERIPRHPDLLVVDVEGGEERVFDSFDLAHWRPRALIVELVDTHPSFLAYPQITDSARRVRSRILAAGYAPIFQDTINTIFWDEAAR